MSKETEQNEFFEEKTVSLSCGGRDKNVTIPGLSEACTLQVSTYYHF